MPTGLLFVSGLLPHHLHSSLLGLFLFKNIEMGRCPAPRQFILCEPRNIWNYISKLTFGGLFFSGPGYMWCFNLISYIYKSYPQSTHNHYVNHIVNQHPVPYFKNYYVVAFASVVSLPQGVFFEDLVWYGFSWFLVFSWVGFWSDY